jgi:hypothetical protein
MESYDSMTDHSEDGCPLKMMPVVDEYTSVPGIGVPAVLVSPRKMRKDPMGSVRPARENSHLRSLGRRSLVHRRNSKVVAGGLWGQDTLHRTRLQWENAYS